MLLRIALFALMAVGLLGFGAVAWVSTHPAAPPAAPAPVAAPTPPAPPPPPPAKVTVTVAAHSLRAGSFIRPDDLHAVEMDADSVPLGAMPDSPAVRGQLNGAMLRRGVGEGEALTAADVFKPGDHGFLASVLAPGMRAVMIGLNGVESGAGFVWPGDRVDVILTEKITDADVRARRRFAGETVLEDARVVAVDQALVPGEATDEGKSGDATGAGHRIAVEVPPEAAERIAVASMLGQLTVSLRPASDAPGRAHLVSTAFGTGQTPESRRVTWSGDVSRALDLPVRERPPPPPQMFRGSMTATGRN